MAYPSIVVDKIFFSLINDGEIPHNPANPLLKVASSQKILEFFYVSNQANINIPNYYPEQNM